MVSYLLRGLARLFLEIVVAIYVFCLAPLDHGQRGMDYASYGDLGLLHRLFDLFRSVPVLLRGALLLLSTVTAIRYSHLKL